MSVTKCRRCGKQIEGKAVGPFCSKQCQMQDLGAWFNEEYRMPVPVTERNVEELSAALVQAELERNRH